MTLLEDWRVKAYGNGLTAAEQDKLWSQYFQLEKGFYEEVLKDPSHVFEGTVSELADHFKIDLFYFTGVLDGVDDSLKGYHNPIETMDKDTKVRIEIDPEQLYYNMVGAKASWLYGLPEWDSILSEEKRKELYRKQKASGTYRRARAKVYPNDPCPCGSGKKYKKCHMRADEEMEMKAFAEEVQHG